MIVRPPQGNHALPSTRIQMAPPPPKSKAVVPPRRVAGTAAAAAGARLPSSAWGAMSALAGGTASAPPRAPPMPVPTPPVPTPPVPRAPMSKPEPVKPPASNVVRRTCCFTNEMHVALTGARAESSPPPGKDAPPAASRPAALPEHDDPSAKHCTQGRDHRCGSAIQDSHSNVYTQQGTYWRARSTRGRWTCPVIPPTRRPSGPTSPPGRPSGACSSARCWRSQRRWRTRGGPCPGGCRGRVVARVGRTRPRRPARERGPFLVTRARTFDTGCCWCHDV